MNQRSLLLGIDGLGGSGKTTYAHQLQQQLKHSIVVHLDDFIHMEKVRYNEDFEEWYGYYYLQWRYDYLIDKLLAPLKNGLAIHEKIELYDKEMDSYIMQEIEIPVGTTVIVEGVFLQRPELRAYFDRVIYLDVDRGTRLKRVINRDTYIGSSEEIVRKYNKRYFPAEDMYIAQCNPLALADAVDHQVKERVFWNFRS
ncbi:uridine kinase [Sporosarcina sp. NPDC096371]|uniref:uridine kinase n=1 Tax=Sporosarcina sp. NPDC096371 TaxID=3364530 RepID=UPI00380B8D77